MLDSILNYMTQSAFMSFLYSFPIFIITGGTIYFMSILIEKSMSLIFRLYRSINILFRGWPPEHLDADGDINPAPKETGEAKKNRLSLAEAEAGLLCISKGIGDAKACADEALRRMAKIQKPDK